MAKAAQRAKEAKAEWVGVGRLSGLLGRKMGMGFAPHVPKPLRKGRNLLGVATVLERTC